MSPNGYSIDAWLYDIVDMSLRVNDANGKRTKEDAEKNILTCTIKENKAKPVILADFNSRGRKVEIEDYGIDNSGVFIESDKKVKADPDWKIVEGDSSYLLEACVHSERFKTCSFKIHKLKKAIKLNGSIIVIRESHYLIFDNAACKYLHDIHDHVPFAGFGGCLSVVLTVAELNLLLAGGIVNKFEYTEAALAVLKPLLKELF